MMASRIGFSVCAWSAAAPETRAEAPARSRKERLSVWLSISASTIHPGVARALACAYFMFMLALHLLKRTGLETCSTPGKLDAMHRYLLPVLLSAGLAG